jgi:hypothetical protein
MKQIRMIQTHLPRIAAPALVILLTACTLEIVQMSGTEAVSTNAAAVIPSNATVTATFSPPTVTAPYAPALTEPLPTVTATQPPVPAGGEWLLVTTEQGLWMARPDGSQAGIRIPGRISVPVPLSDALSQTGGLLAYLSFVFSPNGCTNPVLNIVSLTGRASAAVLPLTSPETACTNDIPIELNDIDTAITALNPLAWSPDGTRLAFIGAQEGSSADLYEYYRVNGQVTRLTDGPDQAYRPLWSPDGAWIVHGAAYSFGSGAGYGMTGFYAARADGGEVRSLYPIVEHSADEVGVGWLDPHTLVASTWMQPCGLKILRLVDLSAQSADVVFEGCMSDVAVGRNAALFAQSNRATSSDANPPPGGIYLVTTLNRTPRLIGYQYIQWIEWAKEIGVFLAVTRDFRVLEISPAGDFRELSAMASRPPTVSPGGHWWAYYQLAQKEFSDTDGIFAGEYGKGMRKIFEGTIASGRLIFSPDGNSLYFVTKAGGLYRAQAPNWSPVLLASGLTSAYGWSDMAWMSEDN